MLDELEIIRNCEGKKLTLEEIENKFMDYNFIKKLTPDDPVGYWLECDIDFKKKLHRKRDFNTRL